MESFGVDGWKSFPGSGTCFSTDQLFPILLTPNFFSLLYPLVLLSFVFLFPACYPVLILLDCTLSWAVVVFTLQPSLVLCAAVCSSPVRCRRGLPLPSRSNDTWYLIPSFITFGVSLVCAL